MNKQDSADRDYWEAVGNLLNARCLYGWSYRYQASFIREDRSTLELTQADGDAVLNLAAAAGLSAARPRP